MEYRGPRPEDDAGEMTRWEVASATLRVRVSNASIVFESDRNIESERKHTFPDVYYKGAFYRRHEDPLASWVLDLQSFMRGGLE